MTTSGPSEGESGSIAIVSGSGTWSYDDLARDAFGLRRVAEAGTAVALQTSDAGVVAAALVALEGWCTEVHLLPLRMAAGALPDRVRLIDASPSAETETTPTAPEPIGLETRWFVYTSGTTGVPKPIAHTRASLTRTVVRTPAAARLTWGLLYDANRMAGLQVLHQALATRTTVVAPDLTATIAVRVEALVRNGVDALSATPTVWRLILQLPGARHWSLRQITLGGEIADQQVLDALAHRYPDARISHVFAATETGAAFSVSDGRAGFPLAYLTEPPRGIRLDIRDGILHVHSPAAGGAGGDGFVSTDDIVEVVGDRVMFKGRVTGVVNVGGVNVWPEEVERLLRSHPDVADAAVASKPNPFSGQILTARVVPADGSVAGDLPKRLRTWMRSTAPRAYVPATIETVAALDLSETGKAIRT